jgi:hypothetical protein
MPLYASLAMNPSLIPTSLAPPPAKIVQDVPDGALQGRLGASLSATALFLRTPCANPAKIALRMAQDTFWVIAL